MPGGLSSDQIKKMKKDIQQEGDQLSARLKALFKSADNATLKPAIVSLNNLKHELDAAEDDLAEIPKAVAQSQAEEKKGAAEEKKAEAEIDALTVDDVIFGKSPYSAQFLKFAKSRDSTDIVEFLIDVQKKVPIPVIIKLYIEKDDINIGSSLRKPILAAAQSTDPKPTLKIFDAAVAEVKTLIRSGILKEFRAKLKEDLKG